MNSSPPNPVPSLWRLLQACIADKRIDQDPSFTWAALYANVADSDRLTWSEIPAAEQDQLMDFLIAEGGRLWGEWLIVRLSKSEPFRDWQRWEERSRLTGGPAVGLESPHLGYLVPLRVFVLPGQIADGPVRRDAPSRRYSEIWPYGAVSSGVLSYVRLHMLCCAVRNFSHLALSHFPWRC